MRADLDLDLGKVNRTRTPWLVFGMHRPFFDSSAASALPELAVMRDALEPLMLKYKVISTRFEVQGVEYKALQHALRCGVFQPTSTLHSYSQVPLRLPPLSVVLVPLLYARSSLFAGALFGHID